MSKKKQFWISFDLGIKGDYDGLFKWLDKQNAESCGINLATFEFNYEKRYLSEVKDSLSSAVEFKRRDSIYLIWRFVDGRTSKVKGRFIIGDRKPAPWIGYSSTHSREDISEEE